MQNIEIVSLLLEIYAFFLLEAICNRGISCYNIYKTCKKGDFRGACGAKISSLVVYHLEFAFFLWYNRFRIGSFYPC